MSKEETVRSMTNIIHLGDCRHFWPLAARARMQLNENVYGDLYVGMLL